MKFENPFFMILANVIFEKAFLYNILSNTYVI